MFQQRWRSSIAKCFLLRDTKTGANERAGFIDAPDTNAKKNMSKVIRTTVPPKKGLKAGKNQTSIKKPLKDMVTFVI
jgi:hypothetical protein